MEKILNFIDQFSFKQIFVFLITTTLIFFLPLIYLESQKPKFYKSRAYFPASPTPVVYEPPPSLPPEITEVKPFFGKAGDEFVILGKNFGNNPKNKNVYIGDVLITNFSLWKDDQIIFLLPKEARSQFLKLRLDNGEKIFPRPITVYSSDDPYIKIKKIEDGLIIENFQKISKIIVWEKQQPKHKEINTESFIKINENEIKIYLNPSSIEWIILLDEKNRILPFWINI